MTVAFNELERYGRFPPIELQIQRVVNRAGKQTTETTAYVTEFLSYRFAQSMLIPVDAFSFSFFPATDDLDRSKPTIDELVKEGDIVSVFYGRNKSRKQIATGIVDSTALSCSPQGESFQIVGRDLLGQLEDQDAISFGEGKTGTYWGDSAALESVVRELVKQTRIADNRIKRQGVANEVSLYATSPGESKLSALLRFLEPMNALVWLDADGTIMLGKPNFKSVPAGTFLVDRKNSQTNVLQMKVTKNAGRIPNGVLGIWTGCEKVQDSFSTGVIINPAERAAALRRAGHIINKTIVVSLPDTNVESSGPALDTLRKKGASEYVKQYVKRLIAKANIGEVDVEVLVPGHCNDNGEPYVADTVYKIFNDRANVDEDMYCYAVDYMMDTGGGQSTSLYFCKLGTIVADAEAP